MPNKEQLFKKYRMIFFIEYLAIAAILILIGFLRAFDVMTYSENRLLVYNIITLIGVAYLIFDLWWNLRPKKRKDFSSVDKIPPMFIGAFLLVFDILVLSKSVTDMYFIKYSVVAVLFAAGLYSTFLGFYHYKKPQKMLLEAVEEAYQEQLAELEAEQKKEEENKIEK